jgi:hypothetical protein
VSAGVSGGLLTLSLYIAVFVVAFKIIGKARRRAPDARTERLIWGVGACLFANTVALFGIVYFDQSVIVWYGLLVMVSALAQVAPGEASIRRSEYSAKSQKLSIASLA